MARALCFAVVAVMGCSQPHMEGAGIDRLHRCRISSVRHPVRCGSLEVPLDRERPQITIALNIVVVPARERPTADPVFLLAGGPGQAATEVFVPLLGQFARLNRDRDLVMIDQRGTGGSNPLRCPPDEQTLTAEVSVDVDAERIMACAEQLQVEPHLYGTDQAVLDLEHVRTELRYDKLNLIGGSYGTRVALEFAREFPERTRTLVLDGVAPMGMKLPLSFARDGQDALDSMIADCEADPACAAAFPDLGDTVAVLTAPGVEPVTTTMAHPRTGEPTEIEIDREQMAAGIRAMLYAPELTSILPLSLSQAREGNYAPLMGQLLAMGDSHSEAFYEGMYLSVICREDVRRIEEAEIESAVEGTFFGRTMVDSMRRACDAWPAGMPPVVPPATPMTHQVSALVLSGALDPATPPRWGDAVLDGLSARHIIVGGAAHGTLTNRCVAGLVADFVRGADPHVLDDACVVEQSRAPFFIDLNGPPV